MAEPMHWLIVGPGALGQLYGGLLAQAGQRVSYWGRQGALAVADYQFDCLTGDSYHWQSCPLDKPIDAVLVTTKIYQSDAATQAVIDANILSPQCPIILMHNGLGAAETLSLPARQPLLLASSRHGALKLAERHVRHTGIGITQLGNARVPLPSRQRQQLLQTLQAATGRVEWHRHILLPLWQKLVINAVINPLTARDKISNGELAQPRYQQEIQHLCTSACQVANAEQIPLQADALLEQINQVVAATAANRSSMLQDVQQRRPTEIDYINGYLVRCAQRHGIDLTAHAQLIRDIHQLSHSFL